MNIAQIEINLQKLIATFNKESFIYDLLLAYGLPKASITRLKKGNLNLSKIEGEISWKKKLFFKEEQKEDLHLTISEITKELKRNERFVIVTDYLTFLAVDTKTEDKLDCVITDLPKHYDFFLPWAGMEKAQHANENPTDVKAAEKMAKLFDVIKKDNPNDSPEFIHGLNVFLSRLLFCFFAEDTHIFEDCLFSNALDSHTQANGRDLNTYLDTLFTVLNTPDNKRENLPEYFKVFPFVNGGLFEKEYKTPNFSRSSRAAILNSGDQDWSAINPDIFGSMFQAVISVDQRGSLGQHYTSVPNIMKVIEPLFLNELYEEFENANGNQKKLKALLSRIHNLKIFDPACGSGNFLIIAYKELRILEMKILKQLKILSGTLGSVNFYFGNDYLSHIHLSQFYGIEIDDFAGEIAKLALWLAEHQMNVEFFNEFGRTNPTLPLKEAGKIVQGNATRLDWEEVCPKNENGEVYVLGNPPYLGARLLDYEQKMDMEIVFIGNVPRYNDLDYISCWFYKAKDYIQHINGKAAFVSTNSICQGSQVSMLSPYIINSTNIVFAHQPFKWTNNAKDKAGVTCVIVGLGNSLTKEKIIYHGKFAHIVSNISPYLVDSQNTVVVGRKKALSNLPEISFGSMPNDGGNLIIQSEEEYEVIVSKAPEIKSFLRVMYGGQDFLKGVKRYCLWITDDDLSKAMKYSFISDRIKLVKEYRESSRRAATNKLSIYPFRFGEIRHQETELIVIPATSSENREYIPMGFLTKGTIVNNSTQAIYHSKPYHLGIVSSKIHMVWLKAVSGRLESRLRYSAELSYNTFPIPQISTQRKNEITQAVFRILEEREKYSNKTLAQLYDPDKMPDGLREAHRQNDEIIEKCYRSTPFTSDEERLEYLFKLYERMIEEEKNAGTLFAKEKKTRKNKK